MKVQIKRSNKLGMEIYEGIILTNDGTVTYQVERWSEEGVRNELIRHIYRRGTIKISDEGGNGGGDNGSPTA